MHIRQKNSSYVEGEAYTVIITTGYGGEGQPSLSEHPSIVEHPENFEITNEAIPITAQYGIYETA